MACPSYSVTFICSSYALNNVYKLQSQNLVWCNNCYWCTYNHICSVYISIWPVNYVLLSSIPSPKSFELQHYKFRTFIYCGIHSQTWNFATKNWIHISSKVSAINIENIYVLHRQQHIIILFDALSEYGIVSCVVGLHVWSLQTSSFYFMLWLRSCDVVQNMPLPITPLPSVIM